MQMDRPKTCQPDNYSTPRKVLQSESDLVTKVRVAVRVRPFLPEEIKSRDGKPISCVSVLNSEYEPSEEVTVHLKDYETSRNECYKLDAFFGQEENNISQIFVKEVNPLIPEILRGHNVTIFAFGATGSGKTYTMQGTENLPGLMPLAMSSILSKSQREGCNIAISYYEIYMDRCYDLLEVNEKEIITLDDKDGQVHLKGLSQVPISSVSEFQEAFSCAVQRRKVAQTGLNDVSSRSHAVLTICVSTPSCDDTGHVVAGKLNLIDLAGNEDNGRTCNSGTRLQESAKINKSLFALSNVIYALNNNQPRIPYRESKLTRVLQDSLGGTSSALMIACLNPGKYQESLHTVNLAARSRRISNIVVSLVQKGDTPKVKVDMEAKLRAWLESKGKTKSFQRVGAFDSPFTSRTPNSICSTRKLGLSQSSSKPKIICNQVTSSLKKRDPHGACRNLFNNRHQSILEGESQELADGGQREEKKVEVFAERVVPESKTLLQDEQINAEEKVMIDEKLCEVTPRKVLSPINSSISNENMSSFSLNSFDENLPALGTPLDKFSARSSNLKKSLVQEYIEFLNTASKEELMEIKGIGQKMAEYIVALRETSPVKSLDDLENIGLSSKQVQNMFRSAAKGVLE